MPDESENEESRFDEFIEPDTLPVFNEELGDLNVRIAPRFNHGRLRWSIRLTKDSRDVYEDVTGLSEDAAENFDIDGEDRQRLNDDRKFVHRKFPSLPVLGNRHLTEYPLADLETLKEEW